jgi:hypothetical protein
MLPDEDGRRASGAGEVQGHPGRVATAVMTGPWQGCIC